MKQNILLCTLGASWAVIPEVYALVEPAFDLYAHHPQKADIDRLRSDHQLLPPDELWVCTTGGAPTDRSLDSLLAWWALLENPRPLRIWRAQGTDQLASQQECESFRELAFRLTLKASHQCQGGQLLLSLAGGRKTMSADLQRAASLFGCHRLLHVVDSGKLPEELFRPEPHNLLGPVPASLITNDQGQGHIMPLVVGHGLRNEILDVALENQPAITPGQYELPDAALSSPLDWSATDGKWLYREIDRRERQSGALLGNYLASISQHEAHENWRQLYRLPTGTINTLRSTQIDQDWLQALPKVDLHRHLGGCLDLAAQQQVARALWQYLNATEQQAALKAIKPLLDCTKTPWDWDWPELLKHGLDEPAQVRSERAAALLCHASDQQLERNLWQVTEPRRALVRKHPGGFAAYERPGELSGSAILQHQAAIGPYAEAIVRQAVTENLAYLELRGSPQKYLGGDGATFLHLFQQALDAALAKLEEKQRPIIRFIIIVDRRASEDAIKQTVALAVAEQQNGFVVGLDLAGDERHDPAEMEHWFAPAFEACLPITIHAGEGHPPEKIWKAAYHLHADRIGHGLSLLQDEKLIGKFRDRGICLELCPSSNREVVGFHDPAFHTTQGLGQYPLKRLWDKGLALCLCTDNPGISRTDITGEYLTAARMTGGLTRWEALAMLKQGFTHAFLPSDEREALLKRLDTRLYRLLLNTNP